MTLTTRNIVTRGSIRVDADQVIAVSYKLDGEEFGLTVNSGKVQLLLVGGGKITIVTADAMTEAQAWTDLLGWPAN